MAAPTGNKFWLQRSTHGRDLLFETPTLLWEAACEYFAWCEDNPLIEVVHDKLKENGIGDKLTMVELPKLRPFTMHGLCIFLDCSTSYFRTFKSEQKDKEDFLSVITRIEEIIYNQKFSGAATGFFNANIISRDLGLTDKKETKHTVKIGKDLEDEIYE